MRISLVLRAMRQVRVFLEESYKDETVRGSVSFKAKAAL
jgi:hypothetical protein